MVVPSSWDNSKEEKNRIEPVIRKLGLRNFYILGYVASNSKFYGSSDLRLIAVGDIFNEYNDVDDESATKIVSYTKL